MPDFMWDGRLGRPAKAKPSVERVDRNLSCRAQSKNPYPRRDSRVSNAVPRTAIRGRKKSTKPLVPSKGLEPPHRCRYMDLNHARLPIPPRWQVDNELQQPESRRIRKTCIPILQTRSALSNSRDERIEAPMPSPDFSQRSLRPSSAHSAF